MPEEAIAAKQRNGEIDRALSFPVEDLYADGQPAGQVGQEVYGAGAAIVFATRAYHRVPGAPFVIFCDYFLRAVTRIDDRTLSLKIDGEDNHVARFALIRTGRAPLPDAIVRKLSGEVITASTATAHELCYDVPPYTGLVLSWRG